VGEGRVSFMTVQTRGVADQSENLFHAHLLKDTDE
jgi:hypothetical protein